MKMNEIEFDKFVSKIVETENPKYSIDAKDIHWKIPLPKTNEEFKKFTKKYYGVELNAEVIVWDDGVSYQIKESHNECCKNELYALWDNKFSQYDGLKVLLKALFGDLRCGGVATSHYGQTKLDKSKRERLVNWDGVDNELKKEIYIRKQQKS